MKWAEALAVALQKVTDEGVKYVIVAYPQSRGGYQWYPIRYGSQAHLCNRQYRGLPAPRTGSITVSARPFGPLPQIVHLAGDLAALRATLERVVGDTLHV